MPSTQDTFNKLKDFLHQLERHTDGRRALHIKMSRLEKHLQEGHFRRASAAALRPLVEKHGAVIFPLPNSDIIIVTKTANLEDIGAVLAKVYRELSSSIVVADLTVLQGVNDNFTTWYDLKNDYQSLVKDVETLEGLGTVASSTTVAVSSLQNSKQPKKSMSRVQYVDVNVPKATKISRDLDPEMLFALTNVLNSADVTSFIEQTAIMAIIEGHGAVPVMLHQYIPNSVIFDHLLKKTELKANPWFDGYLADFIADRMLRSDLNMTNVQSLASSLKVTVNSVMSEAFDNFNRSLGSVVRSKVVLEFALSDMFANTVLFLSARDKIKELGFKYSISNLDLVSLGWANKELLAADFVKVRYPKGVSNYWFDNKRALVLKTRLKDMGIAKFIMEGCEDQKTIARGQSLGFTMFQGSAVG
jgi:SepF-like predicted cell division protein (DUF552 family)